MEARRLHSESYTDLPLNRRSIHARHKLRSILQPLPQGQCHGLPRCPVQSHWHYYRKLHLQFGYCFLVFNVFEICKPMCFSRAFMLQVSAWNETNHANFAFIHTLAMSVTLKGVLGCINFTFLPFGRDLSISYRSKLILQMRKAICRVCGTACH